VWTAITSIAVESKSNRGCLIDLSLSNAAPYHCSRKRMQQSKITQKVTLCGFWNKKR